ncbi:uncharacterized protein LOC112194241 [Rosa chinensis]|uniref:uncharacterized protein LOC112194241 n=1 Tax=Rosa chinensis TaxID=74649 RepID=UPI000D0865FB|nr:uncharacterized protein LOC112194241 [Rosa chinensis]
MVYRVDAVGVNVVSCGCAIRRTHQLPCAHEIAEYRNSHQPIPIDAIHSHWRRLSVGNFVEEIDPQEKVMVRPRLTQLQKWLEEQDDETKRQVLLKIDELINPSCTMLQEPNEKIKTKERPSKIDSSTRRLPSAFEIAEAFSVHGSQSQVPLEKVVHASPSTVLPSTKSNKHPEKNQPICVTQSTSPFELTQKYTVQFVFGMRPYILGSFDVESDGNCGYRVVASAMGFGRRFWRRVRIDLMNELKSMPHLYMKLYGSESSVENIIQRLNHSGSTAPRRKWMCITEMGHLIATCYGVVVINLSDQQCLTFLPLTEHITGRFQNQELPEIGIGFVNGDHFVQVSLQAGCPLPPIPPNWYPHADDKARSLYNRYKDRLHQYTQIPHPERVTAISEIITLETDETMFE